MADENKKAEKQAQKELEKAKKARIKQSKPKKEGNFFTRMMAAIKKFFKDFKGTCKKVVWPDKKTVLKNSGVVFVCIAVLAVIIGLLDWGLMSGVKLAESGVDKLKESVSVAETVNDEPASEATVTEAASTVAEEGSTGAGA